LSIAVIVNHFDKDSKFTTDFQTKLLTTFREQAFVAAKRTAKSPLR